MMMYNKRKISILLIIFLLVILISVEARDSPFTRKGTGPKYWTAYEYCFDKNQPIPETRWKDNIDWMVSSLKSYGYDLICNDGWIETAQTINENGYITKYNSDWTYGFDYWSQYLKERNMKMGIYYNPMWLTRMAYENNIQVKGTTHHAKDIVGTKSFNGELYWVDVDKPGAKEWIQGYVKYFKDLGATYLRVDFLENYETNYGTEKYEKALKWIVEAAGNDLFLSLVMPNCYNHGETELKYGDMIRIDDDCFEGDWAFVSNRRRGEHKDRWPQYGNAFDGFVSFADIGGRGQMILDGDFMRMNKLANDDERRFLFSLMLMSGSALAVADQYDSIKDYIWVYQNTELNELNDLGFVAKPINNNINDALNSSRWVGQLPDGDWVVGLFNREDIVKTRSIDFEKELGIDGGNVKNVRDLWEHKDLGNMSKEYTVELRPHECKVIRIKNNLLKFEAEVASKIKAVPLK
jgi:glucan 1,6-alpha-isomaltosidase